MLTEADIEAVAADPDLAWRAMQLADARESFADFCALIEIPQAPLKAELEEDERDGVDEADNDSEPDTAVFPTIQREDAAHLVLLMDALQKVEAGEITRLMVFMPPGGAKSTYCSVCFPPWFMGRKPRRNVLLATYGSILAKKHGRRARSVVKQKVYSEIFNTGLSAATKAADEWALTNENEFMAGGILSGITGTRADLIVIDDPIKGRAEADSETIRDRTWAEFKDSIRTRIKPGCRMVVVQTRWHEDDLSGRILPNDYDGKTGWVDGKDGDRWYVISIPAEADRDDDPLGRAKGEMFWPEWFPAEHWRAFRQEPRTWASLFQQKPRPDEGSYFLRTWFTRFAPEALPQSVRYVITSDYAVRPKGGDYTVHLVWAIDQAMNVWLVDIWRGQEASDIWIEALIDLILHYRHKGGGSVRVIGEAGVIYRAISPTLTVRMRERKASAKLETMSPNGSDKVGRARGFQAMARAGRVRVIDSMEGDVFMDECVSFPAGRNDDQVDGASLIGRALDTITGAPRTGRPEYADTGNVFS